MKANKATKFTVYLDLPIQAFQALYGEKLAA